ncbi:F-box domain-containing protein [Mycena sanguinolenta]|uniref:F-box domain-containing protein n=1 Tax=Mycena sanguinolenta TaxID=230812 RepID=A0A8H6Z592_9AGAR|nr:F-box domain-containing protein [Mycena sanguinolenta]
MAAARFSMQATLAQQAERTRDLSPIEMQHLIAKCDSNLASLQNDIVSLESRLAPLVTLRDRERAICAGLRYVIMTTSTSTRPRFSMRTILAQRAARTRESLAVQMEQLIAKSDSRVISLQNDIVFLESQLEPLIELRHCERAISAALRYLIAPIRLLPTELLGEIFVLTIRKPENHNSHVCSLHVQDAFRISHVCHHWRQIANALPQLWTGPLEVAFSEQLDNEKAETYLGVLQGWFARSEPLPIPIFIDNSVWPTKFSSRLTEELLRVAHRMQLLSFYSAVSDSLLQRFADSRFDFLEELHLPGVSADAPVRSPNDVVLHIPMPWTQLTDITVLHPVPSEDLLDVFAQCKNVVKAAVVLGWSTDSPQPSVVLALDHLRILHVRWFGWTNLAPDELFLDYLHAPALDTLHLCFQRTLSGMDWVGGPFTAFQLRSPNITKLKIMGNNTTGLSPDALRAALQHAPSLTHLTIDDCPDFIDDALLSALCHADNYELPLVPHLQSYARTYDCVAVVDGRRTGVALEGAHSCPLETDTPGGRWGFEASAQFRDTMEKL